MFTFADYAFNGWNQISDEKTVHSAIEALQSKESMLNVTERHRRRSHSTKQTCRNSDWKHSKHVITVKICTTIDAIVSHPLQQNHRRGPQSYSPMSVERRRLWISTEICMCRFRLNSRQRSDTSIQRLHKWFHCFCHARMHSPWTDKHTLAHTHTHTFRTKRIWIRLHWENTLSVALG